jgi:hypothetical protein
MGERMGMGGEGGVRCQEGSFKFQVSSFKLEV